MITFGSRERCRQNIASNATQEFKLKKSITEENKRQLEKFSSDFTFVSNKKFYLLVR